MTRTLTIAGVDFASRLFLGTGKFSSPQTMQDSLAASGTQLVTVALRRVRTDGAVDDLLGHLDSRRYRLLPNTSGVRDAREAILAAELAREALETNWLKLEIHPDPKYLMPDAVETLNATRELVRRGFIVLPYVHADPVLCKQLAEAGAAAVMPLGAPIGSNQGLASRAFLEIIIASSTVPVVVDAGLGAPSHAAAALEMGADAVLVNTAIAAAHDPVAMAHAFRLGVEAGRQAFEAGLPGRSPVARASSPLTAFLSDVADDVAANVADDVAEAGA
jgi:thiazole synthase